ncbi:MAG: AraC family transcriptional regulator [Pseudomonadales bacterium]
MRWKRSCFPGVLLLVCAQVLCLPAGLAAEPSAQELRSLDEQVQEIKSDVLGIAAELSVLEEQLLFPSNTQVAVFVSLDGAPSFRLDAVRILIDGALAAHHIYSFKELDALTSGGVQRIYTGNLPSGDHQLEVTVIGKLPSGKDYSQTDTFTFRKSIEPSLLGIALAGSSGSAIELNSW